MPDQVGAVGVLLMGPEGMFITGSDFLMGGGVTAAYRYGDLAPPNTRHQQFQGAGSRASMPYFSSARA